MATGQQVPSWGEEHGLARASWSLEACLRCAICLDACPVYGIDPTFPGPKSLVAWWRRHPSYQVPPYSALAGCNGCRRCQIACPAGVPVADLIQSWRPKAKLPSLMLSLRKWFLARGSSWGRWAALLARVVNWLGRRHLVRKALAWGLGISPDQPLPRFSSRPETTFGWVRVAAAQPASAGPEPGHLDRPGQLSSFTPTLPQVVAVFLGCFYRYCRPQAFQALKRLLSGWGCQLYLLDSACCGLPALANGDSRQATRWAGSNLRHFEQLLTLLPSPSLGRALHPDLPVLALCPSCALVLKEVYPSLVPGPAAFSLSRSVVDACQFVLENSVTGGQRSPRPPGLPVAYHLPCHLAAQGIGAPGLELLRRVVGLNIVPLADSCCGAAGTYALKQERYPASRRIARSLVESLAASNARLVATECGMCQVQLWGHTGISAVHPIELLKQSEGKLEPTPNLYGN
ncbi:MAG: anaerobic glycerol-3-phosphate dehydrogenase subunit C [Clostridia bacterium]|nr:anaerobic glycerol-3-phosphate dehydrogenase subunit C [Clostridia bacterium]